MLLLVASELWVIVEVMLVVKEKKAMHFIRQTVVPAIAISQDQKRNAKNVNGMYYVLVNKHIIKIINAQHNKIDRQPPPS